MVLCIPGHSMKLGVRCNSSYIDCCYLYSSLQQVAVVWQETTRCRLINSRVKILEDLSVITVNEMKQELPARKLRKSGNRAEPIARLRSAIIAAAVQRMKERVAFGFAVDEQGGAEENVISDRGPYRAAGKRLRKRPRKPDVDTSGQESVTISLNTGQTREHSSDLLPSRILSIATNPRYPSALQLEIPD